MEALTRLVAESLARYGLDRPVDPRRLQWSGWFRCDSPHSLLLVPSKPGIFALAEEITTLGSSTTHVGTAAFGCPSGAAGGDPEGHGFSHAAFIAANGAPSDADKLIAETRTPGAGSQKPEVGRMLAVFQFSEDDDMAYVLDRMFTRPNPLRARLAKGDCFLRFVVIVDQAQRRTICNALNQWLISSAEKVSGLAADFASPLEVATHLGRADLPGQPRLDFRVSPAGPVPNVQPLPSGF
ncbi:MAG TPA: hypothetical protein VMU61_04305 [Candidatus Aquilonibacter sp.]|nr:hypothetical protein [Candidatus Aquilonibacter sp.]